MSDFTIEQLEALKEGTTPGPWGTMTTGVAGGNHWYVCDLSESLALIAANDGEDEEVRGPNARLMAAAPDLVDALIAEKRAHAKLRAEMGELVEYLSIQEGNDRRSRLYVHGQRSAMELIKDILEGDND